VLAYELAQAALARGFAVHPANVAVCAAGAAAGPLILAKSERLEPALREKLARASAQPVSAPRPSRCLAQPQGSAALERAEFERAARAAGVTAPDELLAGDVRPPGGAMIVDKTPGPGKDPIAASAASHYEGLVSQDLEVTKRRSRSMTDWSRRTDGSSSRSTSGDPATHRVWGAVELGRVVAHLQAPRAGAARREARAVGCSLNTSRPAIIGCLASTHRLLAQVFRRLYLWVRRTLPDVRLRKGGVSSVSGHARSEHDPPCRRWRVAPPFRNEGCLGPSDTSATCCAAGVGGSHGVGPLPPTVAFTFGGANLAQRSGPAQRYGTKNFITPALWTSRFAARGLELHRRVRAEECGPSCGVAAIRCLT